MSWRATGIPGLVSRLERDFKQQGVWEAGQLSPASRVLQGLDTVGTRCAWRACESVRVFLLQLLEMVGAGDAHVFVTGCPARVADVLDDEATTELQRWYGWVHERYGLALSLFMSHPNPDSVIARVSELLYHELDPYLVPRFSSLGTTPAAPWLSAAPIGVL